MCRYMYLCVHVCVDFDMCSTVMFWCVYVWSSVKCSYAYFGCFYVYVLMYVCVVFKMWVCVCVAFIISCSVCLNFVMCRFVCV